MKRIQLGQSNLHISTLGLGTVQLGMTYGYDSQPPPTDKEAVHLIRDAVANGINYIDTAPGYGRSEFLVGQACTGLDNPPIIATKLSIRNPDNGQYLTGLRLRRAMDDSLQNSLRQLRLDVLDLVQIHSISSRFTTPELFDLLAEFKAKGLVRRWGVTTYGEEAPLDALDNPDFFTSLQIPYNVLDRQMESRVLHRAKEQGVGVVLRSVFLQGVLSHRLQTLPDHLAPLQTLIAPLARLARKANVDLGQLALRFAAFSPWADSTIFGTTKISELHDNLRTIQAGPLPDDLLDELNRIEIADPTMLNPGNWQR